MAVCEARFSFPGIESFFSPRRNLQERELVIQYMNCLPLNHHFSAEVKAYRGKGRKYADYLGLSDRGLTSVEALNNLSRTIRRIDHKREPEFADFTGLCQETPFDASMKKNSNIRVRVTCQAGGFNAAVLVRGEVERTLTYFPLLSIQTEGFGELIASLSKVNLDPDLLKNFLLGIQVRSLV